MTLPSWNTACPDWEERLLHRRPLVPDLPLFREEAARGLRVFKRLRLPDVAGTPMLGDVCDEWFLAFVAAFFGSFDAAANRRMISEYFELIPKGNSKSSYGGELAVAALIVNRRPRAEIALIAPTKLVADIAFDQAEGTIALDELLMKLFHCQRHIRTITHLRTNAWLKIKAADTDIVTGGKQLGTFVDETHELAKSANAQKVIAEIRGALGKRPDGFFVQMTTQSKEPPSGVFKQELERARAVRDGTLQLPLLPLLYELPERLQKDDGWKDRKYWPCVNPNLNRSIDEQFLIDGLRSAEATGREALTLFASQHFNVQIGLSMRSDRWNGASFWKARADKALSLAALLQRSEVVVIGIDGGGLDDLFGLTVLGREALEVEYEIEVEVVEGDDSEKTFRREKRAEKRWLSWSHAWCHEGVLELRQSIAPRLRDFEAAGELTIMGDELGDLSAIIDVVSRVKEAGLLHCVAVDPAGLGELVDALAEIGVTQDNREQERDYVVGVAQGYALMNAIKTGERRLARKSLIHADQALMDWCVGNIKIEPTPTAIRATKQNAGDAKVDPAFALFDAITIMSTNPPSARSVYEERGLLVL